MLVIVLVAVCIGLVAAGMTQIYKRFRHRKGQNGFYARLNFDLVIIGVGILVSVSHATLFKQLDTVLAFFQIELVALDQMLARILMFIVVWLVMIVVCIMSPIVLANLVNDRNVSQSNAA